MPWICPDTGRTFETGATASPRHVLCGAIPFVPLFAPPTQVAYVPKVRSNFGNDRFGDCVSAEEAFAKSCPIPGVQVEADIAEQTVIDWARSHGVLNGAALDEVLDWMAQKGMTVGSQLYNDGPKSSVDYSNEPILQAAIAQGPVKVAIGAGALPGGAGSRDGWYALGGRDMRTDHAVALCGYGPAGWLYQQLGVPLPSALQATLPGYLLYTWSTIGFVDHPWIMGTVVEAWLRTPTTIGVPPLTPPTPPPPPPGPGPLPPTTPVELTIDGTLPAGSYILLPKVTP